MSSVPRPSETSSGLDGSDLQRSLVSLQIEGNDGRFVHFWDLTARDGQSLFPECPPESTTNSPGRENTPQLPGPPQI